jgi:hypothetical protein
MGVSGRPIYARSERQPSRALPRPKVIASAAVIRWLVAATDLLAAIACLRRGFASAPSAAAGIWKALGATLVVGLAAKTIHVEITAVEGLRALARQFALYGLRRVGQIAFLLALPAIVWLGWRRLRLAVPVGERSLRYALAGAAVLVAFACIRACSYHYTDRVLDRRWAGVIGPGDVIQAAANAWIALAARARA